MEDSVGLFGTGLILGFILATVLYTPVEGDSDVDQSEE